MNSFIEDYLNSPSAAIASAAERSRNLFWTSDIDDDMVYDALASGEFRLYEAMILSSAADGLRSRDAVRPVA